MKLNDGINIKDEKIYSFLMIGQSNMAGRGEFFDLPPIKNPDCYMLKNGRWQPMREPVNVDRYVLPEDGDFHSGCGLAPALADEMARDEGRKIGLIPCADGGTGMWQWQPGEVLFDHAVMQAKLAQRSSEIIGILWHQGESDCRGDEKVALYKERFLKMARALRAELGELPIIIGELAWNIDQKWEVGDRVAKLNAIFHEIADELPLCAVASSEGLRLKKDGIHFNTESLRIFGKRYYECYKNLK